MILQLFVTFLILAIGSSFTTPAIGRPHSRNIRLRDNGVLLSANAQESGETAQHTDNFDFLDWAKDNDLVISDSIAIRKTTEEERGKGGIEATETIAPLQVLATIPLSLVIGKDISPSAMEIAAKANNLSWAVDLTAATLVSRESSNDSRSPWIASWKEGGWATNNTDLGPPDASFGPGAVTGNLMATGSDNDHNIYAKFRMPCHPVVFRAARGLAMLTECPEDEALAALTCRGQHYRSMRDALQELVSNPSSERKGSNRERKCWDVADALSRVLSRVTLLEWNEETIPVIVPIYERLAHSSTNSNVKLVTDDDEQSLLVVATREIPEGSPLTRDYTLAPRLDKDDSKGPLRLLLQFGLPPNSW